MSRIVIACYKPKPGQNEALRGLMLTHLTRLRDRGTRHRQGIHHHGGRGRDDRRSLRVEIEAGDRSRTHEPVLEMWDQYAAVCDYVPVSSISEATQLFSEFNPLNR